MQYINRAEPIFCFLARLQLVWQEFWEQGPPLTPTLIARNTDTFCNWHLLPVTMTLIANLVFHMEDLPPHSLTRNPIKYIAGLNGTTPNSIQFKITLNYRTFICFMMDVSILLSNAANVFMFNYWTVCHLSITGWFVSKRKINWLFSKAQHQL